MNITRNLICAFLTTIFITGLFTTSNLHASDGAAVDEINTSVTKPGELYLPSEDAMADVSKAIDTARDNNKLVLVVMGANWCHDSRALASRLYEGPLETLITENYETVFVDVGYLEKGKDVITSLGSPVYYATPTVLIVDPASGEVINARNRHQWANAASISMQASIDYFQQMANTDMDASAGLKAPSARLQELLLEIEAFEQLQADRLYAAYAVLGPMLRAYENGDKEAFSESHWNEVRDFRYQVPKDVDSLRMEASERVKAEDTEITLHYPQYPPFSWEHQVQ
jgi:hypothetical protein